MNHKQNPALNQSGSGADMHQKVVGRSVPRIDAPDKARGTAQYTADMKLPGMLHGKVLRSPYPHAEIRHIDTIIQNFLEFSRSPRFEAQRVSPSVVVDRGKERNIVLAAEAFIRLHGCSYPTRFDVIAVIYRDSGMEIEHVENAFYPKVNL